MCTILTSPLLSFIRKWVFCIIFFNFFFALIDENAAYITFLSNRNKDMNGFREKKRKNIRHIKFALGCKSDQEKWQTLSLLHTEPESPGGDTSHGLLGGLGWRRYDLTAGFPWMHDNGLHTPSQRFCHLVFADQMTGKRRHGFLNTSGQSRCNPFDPSHYPRHMLTSEIRHLFEQKRSRGWNPTQHVGFEISRCESWRNEPFARQISKPTFWQTQVNLKHPLSPR